MVWNSTDDSLAQLRAFEASAVAYRSVHIEGYDIPLTKFKFRDPVKEREFELRTATATARNRLLQGALQRDHTWVLWVDSHVTSLPADALTRLLASGEQVVSANAVRDRASSFLSCDESTFRESRPVDWWRDVKTKYVLLDSSTQATGRKHLSDLADLPSKLQRVDGVGGVCLLVRADVHRRGIHFPPLPFHKHVDTEGFAQLCTSKGVTLWGLTDLRVAAPPPHYT